MKNNDTFYKINNKQIYDSLEEIKGFMISSKKDINKNKCDIALNRKLIFLGMGSALSLSVMLISALVLN